MPVAVAGHSNLAPPSLLLYLAAYAVTNLAAFTVVAAFPARRHLDEYRGLARSRPWLAGALLVSLIGLVGPAYRPGPGRLAPPVIAGATSLALGVAAGTAWAPVETPLVR